MTFEQTNQGFVIGLEGRIDSNNAAEVEKEIFTQLEGKENLPIVIDAEKLDYISSAGLRVILHLRKINSDLCITNTSSAVYEILEMTGFTEMMKVEKAYRIVSVEGCEEIGRGANGTIYRIDQDNVVKVYNFPDALDDIQHEREVAKLALILGIPTAISYDVVRVGDSYGSVFELLNASSFSKILATQPEKMDWCVEEYVEMLKRIHSTLVPEGKLPDLRETFLDYADFLKGHLPDEQVQKLRSLIEAVPHDDHMVHGDYHTKNLELQGDEVLLIDMDTLAVGHPVFELASMFNAFIGFSELDHNIIKEFQGFDFETSKTFWHKVLAAYLGTEDEEYIQAVENKVRILGYTRLLRRAIRRDEISTEQGKEAFEFRKKQLFKLLDETDTLLFERKEEKTEAANELVVDADTEKLAEVNAFISRYLEAAECSVKTEMEILLAVEEIFTNVASYAYKEEKGKAIIRVMLSERPSAITISIIDWGIPYDPLAKEDPDVTLSADKRDIGGLGVFLAKQVMDEIDYERTDGQNILTMKKILA
ncbi:MAG: anti-sigma factor antagonist [Lachnospiraceae bacterium]|nr:anti-sigma factor antagonist [Lachnospiraceae bacterium]